MRGILVLITIILGSLLSGCGIASPEARNDASSQQVGPTIQMPIAELVDLTADKSADAAAEKASEKATQKTTAAVSAVVDTKMKTVQDTLSGLITGKVDEIGKLIDLNATIENKLNLKADVNNVIKALSDVQISMNTEFKNDMDFRNTMNANVKALSDNVLKLNTNFQGMVDGITGQAGVNNTMDVKKVMETLQQEFKAGRDVYNNSFPKEAVDIMIEQMRTSEKNERTNEQYNYWTIIGVLVIIKLIMVYFYRLSRLREINTNKLLSEALAKMEPHQAQTIQSKML